MNKETKTPPTALKHDHVRCRTLANDLEVSPTDTHFESHLTEGRPQNILLYGRKTEDVSDVMDLLTQCISHIIQNNSTRTNIANVYVEGWVLELIRTHTTLEQDAQGINLVEWLPPKHGVISSSDDLSDDQPLLMPTMDTDKTLQDFSFVYCIGGDGTLLRLLRVLFFKCIPPTLPKIITFSKGSLNYLCNFGEEEFKKILDATCLAQTSKDLAKVAVQYRSRLACTVENTLTQRPIVTKKMYVNSDGETEYQPSECHALNEITVTRGDSEFMCRFDIYVNDVFWTVVQGDGVMMSTPTGSTAYNLSCGGPIAHPMAEIVCLTPICAHSLAFRPVILPASAKITIRLPEGARSHAMVSFDGQLKFKMERNEQIVIQQSAYCVPFVHWSEQNQDSVWVNKLDKTLQWNQQTIQKPLQGKSSWMKAKL